MKKISYILLILLSTLFFLGCTTYVPVRDNSPHEYTQKADSITAMQKQLQHKIDSIQTIIKQIKGEM